jgi:hypothetical protein
VQTPPKRAEGVIRGQGETTVATGQNSELIMMVAVAVIDCRDNHGTDYGHSGRCERFIAVHSEQVSGQTLRYRTW